MELPDRYTEDALEFDRYTEDELNKALDGRCVTSRSKDGNYIVAGDTTLNGDGCVYVFVKSGDYWDKQAAISPDSASSSRFGKSVAISADGAYFAAGADWSVNDSDDCGEVLIYARSGSTWTLEAILDDDRVQFGSEVDISDDGSRIVVGFCQDDTYSYICVYDRSGSAWSQSSKVPVGERKGAYWLTVTISGNGNYIAATAMATNLSLSGAELVIHTFKRCGDTWIRYGVIEVLADFAFVRRRVAVLSNDGRYILLKGDFCAKFGLAKARMSMRVYNNKAGTWKHLITISASENNDPDYPIKKGGAYAQKSSTYAPLSYRGSDPYP